MVSLGGDSRPPLAAARPKCNSILHMFGEWLFEAAHIGSEAAYYGKGPLQSKFTYMRSGFSTLSNESRTAIPPTKSIFFYL
jgi:hypothetical protein